MPGEDFGPEHRGCEKNRHDQRWNRPSPRRSAQADRDHHQTEPPTFRGGVGWNWSVISSITMRIGLKFTYQHIDISYKDDVLSAN